MKKYISIFLFFVLITGTSSCSNNGIYFDEGKVFKYSEGYHIGDIIDFYNSSIIINNDTIYINETPVALLLKIENRWLIGDKVLHIQQLNGNEKGRYIEK